ncbi:MAG: dienelactone hydrolase family protein [Candidatus Nitrosopolaris sp.]
MTAYLSRTSDSAGSHPAIIVIHEAWGLNEQIMGVTRRCPEEGFVAIAPNLFPRPVRSSDGEKRCEGNDTNVLYST